MKKILFITLLMTSLVGCNHFRSFPPAKIKSDNKTCSAAIINFARISDLAEYNTDDLVHEAKCKTFQKKYMGLSCKNMKLDQIKDANGKYSEVGAAVYIGMGSELVVDKNFCDEEKTED